MGIGRLLLFFWVALAPLVALPKKQGTLGSLIPSHGAPRTIVIDPGHGGRDRGARSKGPFCEEKRLCLEVSRLVKKHLDAMGYKVVMTRTSDDYLTLPRRVEIAEQAHCDLFVSIHFNASHNIQAQGIEVFFHDSKKQKQKSRLSQRLADRVLRSLLHRTTAPSRGVKKGNFYVIRETKMPAVLIEGGFLTHQKEKSLLRQHLYQEKLARGIAEGIDTYFRRGKK